MLDRGPGGGVRGGEVIAVGTPEKVAKVAESYTGQYLAQLLSRVPAKAGTSRKERATPELAS